MDRSRDSLSACLRLKMLDKERLCLRRDRPKAVRNRVRYPEEAHLFIRLCRWVSKDKASRQRWLSLWDRNRIP